MFESLSEKMVAALDHLKGKGRIRPRDVEEVIKKIRMSLLEADVHYRVVQDFSKTLSEKVTGIKLLPTMKPEQQIVALVQKEMENLIGEPPELDLQRVVLLGLQGSGKTTTAAKLANQLKQQGQHPLLIPADLSRPAAIDQLKSLAARASIDCHPTDPKQRVVKVVKAALGKSEATHFVIDTAGRLQIDEKLMDELKKVIKQVDPTATILVVDAMSGQEAVNVAEAFNGECPLDGIILSKMDGDARGGAALSIRATIGVPLLFLGVGENLDGLEKVQPNRLVGRILGMGDMTGLMEKAQSAIDTGAGDDIEGFGNIDDFRLGDFLKLFKMLRRMGPLSGLLKMIPGMPKQLKKINSDGADKEFRRIEAMVLSMTPSERDDHQILDPSRKRRIALGSGTSVADINRFLKQYTEMKKMMKKLGPAGLSQFTGR